MSNTKINTEKSLSRDMFTTESNTSNALAGDFGSLIESDIVEFVVGSDENSKSYRIHSAFVIGQSETLGNYIHDNRTEDRVVLDFIEPETFLCFIEYTMRGMYALPTRTATRVRNPTERSSESGSLTKSVRTKTTLANILTHAKIYTFATEYGISDLAAMASRYLNGSLKIAERYCDSGEASSLINVILYIYGHNIVDAYKSVAAVCAKNISSLSKREDFRQLVAAGGFFATYLVDSLSDLVRRRDYISDTGSKLNTPPRPSPTDPSDKPTATNRKTKDSQFSTSTRYRRASVVSFTSGSDISETMSSQFTTAGSNLSTTSNSESGSTIHPMGD